GHSHPEVDHATVHSRGAPALRRDPLPAGERVDRSPRSGVRALDREGRRLVPEYDHGRPGSSREPDDHPDTHDQRRRPGNRGSRDHPFSPRLPRTAGADQLIIVTPPFIFSNPSPLTSVITPFTTACTAPSTCTFIPLIVTPA